MKRVGIDMNLLKEQQEIVDVLADRSPEDEQELLDGLSGFLGQIISGKIVCFWKETSE
jgi:hypothetical protein